MGMVYSNAFLTIIAAAGDGASYGLPGVGKVVRQTQHEVSLGNCSLVQLYTISSSFLKDTKWATRGWTYQEGYFPKRRLIFTDQQVLYLCNEKYDTEALRLLKWPAMGSKEFLLEFSDLVPFKDEWGEMPRFLFSHIDEYSKRELSYEEDSLKAIQGILTAYEKNHSPIHHLCGIPIWRATDSKLIRICILWRHTTTASRRLGFPSWSWAGWKGAVEFIREVSSQPDAGHFSVLTKENELHDEFTPLDDIFNQQDRLDLCTRYLRVKGDFIHLSFRSLHLTEEQQRKKTCVRPCERWRTAPDKSPDAHWQSRCSGTLAVFEIQEGLFVATKPVLDQDVALEDGMLGIVFADSKLVVDGMHAV